MYSVRERQTIETGYQLAHARSIQSHIKYIQVPIRQALD